MISIMILEKNKGTMVLESRDKLTLYLGKKDVFVWVDVRKPVQKEMEFLEKHFSFHPLAIEDCMTTIQRPKIDTYDSYLFIVLHAAILAAHKDKASSLELDSFVGENYVVTVHLKSIDSITSTWERCLKNKGIMSRGGVRSRSRFSCWLR